MLKRHTPSQPILRWLIAAVVVVVVQHAHAGFVNPTISTTWYSDTTADTTHEILDDAAGPFASEYLGATQQTIEVDGAFSSYAYAQTTQVLGDSLFQSTGYAVGSAITHPDSAAWVVSHVSIRFDFQVDAAENATMNWGHVAEVTGQGVLQYVSLNLREGGASVFFEEYAAFEDATTSVVDRTFHQELHSGQMYSLYLSVQGRVEFHEIFDGSILYGSFGNQWQFSLTIPAPSTLTALAPFGALFTPRRRRA